MKKLLSLLLIISASLNASVEVSARALSDILPPTLAPATVVLRGSPPPWGTMDDLAERGAPGLSKEEIGWVAANLDLIGAAKEIATIGKHLVASSPCDLLFAEGALAMAMAKIMENPSATAYGSYAPYAIMYSRLVTGWKEESLAHIKSLAVVSSGAPSLTAPSVRYFKSHYTPGDWHILLHKPLSVSQVYAVRAMLGGALTAIPTMSAEQREAALNVMSVAGSFCDEMSLESQADLLAQAMAKMPAF